MTGKQLSMDHESFSKFTAEQRAIYKTPGSPDGIVLSASDFLWLDEWERFEKGVDKIIAGERPMNDRDRKLGRIAHYAGWIACEKAFRI